MRVAIVGSRNYPNPVEVAEFVLSLPPDTVIVTGGAHGPDAWAAHVAEVAGFPDPIVIRPDWDQFGRSAGMIRNGEIVKQAEILFAFWDGNSSGTRNSIKRAGESNKLGGVFAPMVCAAEVHKLGRRASR